MCEHPFINKSLESSLFIVNYSEPAVVGTTVSFKCSKQGPKLLGPNTTTCMNDGQWEPDPNQLSINNYCKGMVKINSKDHDNLCCVLWLYNLQCMMLHHIMHFVMVLISEAKLYGNQQLSMTLLVSHTIM